MECPSLQFFTQTNDAPKRNLDKDFFLVLKQITDANAKSNPSETLRDLLLRDSLPRISENDQSNLQIALNNLHSYIDAVHHKGYSPDLMHCTVITPAQLFSSTERFFS